jgi:glycerol uptake facilitator-like aquaporin
MTLDPSLLLVDRLRHSGLSVHNRLLINLLSEFFATFILLFVGSGTVAQLVLAKGGLNDYVQVDRIFTFYQKHLKPKTQLYQ